MVKYPIINPGFVFLRSWWSYDRLVFGRSHPKPLFQVLLITEPKLHAARYVQHHFKTRQHAIFPELQDIAQRYNLRLTMQELSKADWLSNPDKSPYAHYLAQLTSSSIKLQMVRQTIHQLKANVNGTGEPEKLVIVSCHPVVAFIFFLWVQMLDVGTVAFYHAFLRFKARQQLADAFEERKAADGKYLVKSNCPRILIGTAGDNGGWVELEKSRPKSFSWNPTISRGTRNNR